METLTRAGTYLVILIPLILLLGFLFLRFLGGTPPPPYQEREDPRKTECRTCQGTGYAKRGHCPQCGGYGWYIDRSVRPEPRDRREPLDERWAGKTD